MNRFATCLAGLVISAAGALAGEKTVMHCFAFTPIETASQAEWNAFYKATDELPGKVPGLKRVWYGKLNRPLAQNAVQFPAGDEGKQMRAEKKGTAPFTILTRSNGACMEFESLDAFKAYDANPAHKAWVAVYEKVRVPGTTTYQILGQ